MAADLAGMTSQLVALAAKGAARAAGVAARLADAAARTASRMAAIAAREEAAAAHDDAAAAKLAAAYARQQARKVAKAARAVARVVKKAAKAVGHAAVTVAKAAYKYSGAQDVVSCVTDPHLSSCVKAAVTVALVVATAGEGEVEVAAMEAAEQAGTRAAEDLPTLVIDAQRMPNIARNVQSALDEGKPSILNRTTNDDLIEANRAAATRSFSGPGSPDEYPFASTYQGGAGARVAGVPLREQRVQGGIVSHFYAKHQIGDGDPFRVVVTGL